VQAKRYLCATAPGYLETLSEPSKISLELQGGVMNQTEVTDFEKNEFYKEAIHLRRWDDLAKDPYLISPTLDSFINEIETSLK
jgi:predicted HD phosphohydrolase